MLSNNDMTIFDEYADGDQAALEAIVNVTDIGVGSLADILALKQSVRADLSGISSYKLNDRTTGPINNVAQPVVLDNSDDDDALVIVDKELLLKVFSGDSTTICKLIKQLNDIKEGTILNVIIELEMPDLNYFVIDAGTFISNMIRNAKGTKVFNFGAQASVSDLMIAMCCDEVYVSDFASVSVTKADNGSNIARHLIPIYKHAVESTYKYWSKLGLFTSEEIDGLFSSEADNSIQLLSDEIKRRLSNQSE